MEENGRLIKFLYNEDREVVAEETSNGTITRYIRGLGIISSDSEEAKTYYHYVSDEQGSITHVLSEDAEILNHYSYDAFGNIIEKTEKVENRFCYNGEMLDPVTQQYYLRARFYNPVIGRFTQEDTYYGDGLKFSTVRQIRLGMWIRAGIIVELHKAAIIQTRNSIRRRMRQGDINLLRRKEIVRPAMGSQVEKLAILQN